MYRDIRNILFCEPINSLSNMKTISLKDKELFFSDNFNIIVPIDGSKSSFSNKGIESTKSNSMLSCIDGNNKELLKVLQGEYLFQSTYIWKDFDSNHDSPSEFWDCNYPHLGVSFIFLDTKYKINFEKFECCREKIEKDIKNRISTNEIVFRIYNSVDLCDFVVIWKSTKEDSLTQISDEISTSKEFSYYRFIYGVSDSLFSTENLSDSFLNKCTSLKNALNTETIFFNLKIENEHKINDEPNDELFKCCLSLLELFKCLDIDEFTWKEPFAELLNMLLSLSQNNILKNICFLLLDGASIFCKWLVKACNESKKEMVISCEQNIYTYLRAWQGLIEKIIKSEIGFTIKSGYLPRTFNFSIRMVEFYNAFLNKVADFLHQVDSFPNSPNTQDDFACLTVPKLCRRIKTCPIIPDDNPPCYSLLYVDLPFSSICDPFRVMTSLLHETSHLLTDEIRCREERTIHFMLCIALDIANNLELDNYAVVELIFQKIKQISPESEKNYLRFITADLSYGVSQMLLNSEFLSDLVVSYCESNNPNNHMAPTQLYAMMNETIANGGLLALHPDHLINYSINDLDFLFGECYADAIMVYTLQLSVEDYIKVFESEIAYFEDTETDYNSKKALILQRILIVERAFSIAFNKELNSNNPLKKPKFYDDFIEIKEKYEKCSFTSRISPDYFTKDTIYQVILYIVKCLKILDEKNNGNAKKLCEDIRKVYNSIISSDNVIGPEFEKFVCENRNLILNKFITNPN